MITLLLALCTILPAQAQQDSLLVMFWNVENFFDYHSPDKPRYWTRGRFITKCNAVSKEILRVAGKYGRYPDAIGFAEVENGFVMRRLLSDTPLRKLGYGIVHFESHDHRGIDCALIYRRSSLSLSSGEAKHLYDSSGAIMATRDIIAARFDSLAILVNHHPSQIGGKTGIRNMAVARMNEIADSLLREGCRSVVAIGDFNQDHWNDGSHGTIRYNGKWEKIDGHFIWGNAVAREDVFTDPLLMTADRSYGGLKPLRTFSGPRYLGGVSDHLPIVVTIYF